MVDVIERTATYQTKLKRCDFCNGDGFVYEHRVHDPCQWWFIYREKYLGNEKQEERLLCPCCNGHRSIKVNTMNPITD